MPLAWLGGIFLFLQSDISPVGFWIGVPIAVAGMLTRAWASVFIEGKNIKLATGGPFAYVRNPLYVGNFLIGLGIVMIVRNWLTITVFLGGFAILYWGTIRKEEENLKKTFGEAYLRYLKAVPRFIPRLTAYSGRDKAPVQWKLLWKHRELETFCGLLLVIVGLYLWDEVIRQGVFACKQKAAAGAAVVLVIVLILERVLRCKKKK